jgi:hypothetical protein
LAPSLTPPSRPGFPPTHDLLEEIWRRTVDACDAILRERPFLLGERFTLADASAYGQLSMNLTDPAAARLLRERSPTVFTWLESIRDRENLASDGELSLAPVLGPLVDIIVETFAPLMRANERAYVDLHRAGATRFNESAFDAGVSLYDGEILGHPFRSVAKTFQVRAWRDLETQWRALSSDARGEIQDLVPRHLRASIFDDPPAAESPAPARHLSRTP